MRSEGFSFNFGGLGVEPCSRGVVLAFATVRNRPASECGRVLRAAAIGGSFWRGFSD